MQTELENAPAHELAIKGKSAACEYCSGSFTAKRTWHKFCSEPCRRAFEKVIAKVATKLHPLIREGVRELKRASKQ